LTAHDLEEIKVDIAGATKPLLSIQTVDEILNFTVFQGRVTRDQLKEKFSLAENNQLRPLMAALQNKGLVKIGRGIYPTPRLIQAFKINKISALNDAGKGVSQNENIQPLAQQILDPSLSDDDSPVNLDKSGESSNITSLASVPKDHSSTTRLDVIANATDEHPHDLVLRAAAYLTQRKGQTTIRDLEEILAGKIASNEIYSWMESIVKEGLADVLDWGKWRIVGP
jgi:hypothetical protein